jgi:hypothetical protein
MKPIFTMSFLTAVAACFGPLIIGPWVFHNYAAMDSATHASLLLTVCWLLVLATALFRFKKRGLWLLLGLPFALFWPCVFLAIASSCAHNSQNCP